MSNVKAKDVKLSCDLTFDKFATHKGHTEIISNKNFKEGDWNALCKLKKSPPNVHKRVIPVDFRDFCMLVVTEVAPHSSVKKHSHAEGIVRFVISGSFNLNGVKYDEGDWVLVPESVPYEITTETGYVVIAGYRTWCEEPPSLTMSSS